MSRALRHAAAQLSAATAVYLIVAFVLWDFDLSKLHAFDRLAIVLGWFLFAVMAAAWTNEIDR